MDSALDGRTFQLQDPLDTTPRAAREQRILESFLLEMDIEDIQSVTSNGDSTISRPKRRAEVSSLSQVKKPDASWKRRKQELGRLRSETLSLETYLALLRLQRTREVMLNELSPEQRKWKNTTEAEKLRCQLSMEENTRLKKKLQHCAHICNSMNATVAAINDALTTEAWHFEIKTRNYANVISSVVFDMLESKLNARVNESDAVLMGTSIRAVNTDEEQVKVHRGNTAGRTATLELKCTRLMPFSAKKTSDTLWSVMKLGVLLNERGARVDMRSKNMLASEGCIIQPLECGGSVEIRTRCLKKRVEMLGRFVVLVESATEWIVRPNSSKEWIHYTRDSGCAVVNSVDDVVSDGSTCISGVCQTQTSLRLQTNDYLEMGPNVHSKTPSLLSRTVSNVVIPAFRQIFSKQNQLVDNLLLDASLASV